MFHLFFQSTLRQFRKNKSYTLINVIGLAVGIAFSILTYSVVSYELSFDQHHDDADRILRINTVSVRQSERREMPATPFPLVPALLESVPEVEKATRIWFEKNIKILSDSGFAITEGSLYPILHKLEEKGFITSRVKTVKNRDRKYYAITFLGSQEFENKETEIKSIYGHLIHFLAT